MKFRTTLSSYITVQGWPRLLETLSQKKQTNKVYVLRLLDLDPIYRSTVFRNTKRVSQVALPILFNLVEMFSS